jgi:hypothetical protein
MCTILYIGKLKHLAHTALPNRTEIGFQGGKTVEDTFRAAPLYERWDQVEADQGYNPETVRSDSLTRILLDIEATLIHTRADM